MGDLVNKRLGSWIASLRRQRLWTQAELAGFANLTERTIQRVERGESASARTLRALASVFNVDVEMFRAPPDREAGADPMQHRVFVAEDSPSDQELLALAFTNNGLRPDIRFFPDGEALLRCLIPEDGSTARLPHLIVLDLNMPRMNGFEVLERISKVPTLQRIRIVVLTSSDREQDVGKSYELGAAAFVSKPDTFEGWIELVGSLAKFWLDGVTLAS